MEVEDSKNDLEVGLDKDFLSFKPLSKRCRSLFSIPLSINDWGLPKPCNTGGKIIYIFIFMKVTPFLTFINHWFFQCLGTAQVLPGAGGKSRSLRKDWNFERQGGLFTGRPYAHYIRQP